MSGPYFDRNLFEKEIRILEAALAEIAGGELKDDELLPKYKEMVSNYEKLLVLNQKIFKISDIQAKILINRESEIKNLLDNAGQGFLTIGKELNVKGEYSAECIRIFGRKIGKANILTLLTSEDDEQNKIFAAVLEKIWQTEDEVLQRSYLDKLPGMVKVNECRLTVEYRLVNTNEGGREPLLMLILTDVTEKHKAQEILAYLSYHDKLTSLYNRAYIDTWLAKFQPCRHSPLSVIVADVNGLKLTNDVFGHAQGDRLLVQCARVLARSCRKDDIVARWGGDEFLILLPATDAAACAKVCARIKAACAREKGLPIELSVSLGMAVQQRPDTGISDLLKSAEKSMYSNKLRESKQVRRKIIMNMEEILHTRCFEDRGHLTRVKTLAFNFAKYLGFLPGSIEMQNLTLLAALHDIGKAAIPEEILGKPGPLSKDEWKIMQNHSETGFRMAQSIGETAVAEAILALHERWDGRGYPLGLHKEQIPLLARLFAIVHTYDVMTRDRPYRRALSREEALKELEKGGGSQFDPGLTRLFLNNVIFFLD